jgi:hypothetical protein
MLRGIRYRSGRSLVVLLLAAFATTAAVLIPAYERAAEQSVLTDGMRSAPPVSSALTVSAENVDEPSVSEVKAAAEAALRKAPHLQTVLDRAVTSIETETVHNGLKAKVAWRLGACAELKVTGTCAIDAEQAVVSERSAAAAGIKTGDKITVAPGKQLEVTGLYVPKDPASVYWGNSVYFAHSAERLDAIITGAETDVPAEKSAVKITYALKPDAIKADDLLAIRQELGALGIGLSGANLTVETALLSLVDDVNADQAVIQRSVPVIAVPLLILALIVLVMTVAAVAEERSPELALARLRGFPQAKAARFGLNETLFLIVVSTPLGFAGGLAVTEVAARTGMAQGTHAEIRWQVIAAAVVSLAAAAAAAWLATRRTFARGVLTLLRRVPQRTKKRAAVYEAIAGTLALIGVAAALRDPSAPEALLAPPALALVAGIVAGRVLTFWASVKLAMARRSGRIPSLLAGAHLSRRPGPARTAIVLTAAVALLAFSAATWDAAARARALFAEESLGAATVYQVGAAHPEALIKAVAAADPSGASMAVVRTDEQYGQGRVELIGVQADQLSKVALWRDHDQARLSTLGNKLRAGTTAPATIQNDITLKVTASGLGDVPLRLGAIVSIPGQAPVAVWLGELKAGVRDYSAPIAGCSGQTPCRLGGIVIGRSGGLNGAVKATLSLHEIRSSTAAVAARLSEAKAWKAATDRNPAAKVQIRAGEPLGLTVESAAPGDVVVSYLDTPESLPVVLAGPVPGDADTFTFPGLADVSQSFTVIEREVRLPRAGDHALLFDLGLAARSASLSAGLAEAADLRYEVWANASAPADLPQKLADQGVRLLRTHTMDSELEQLGRRAPALAWLLYLLAGIAAAALGLGVLLLSRRLNVGERRDEFAALRATGVRPRVLKRALRRERLSSLVLPMLLGLATGIGAAILMLSGVPLVTPGAITATPDLLPKPELAALPVAFAGVLLVIVAGMLTAGRLLKGGSR